MGENFQFLVNTNPQLRVVLVEQCHTALGQIDSNSLSTMQEFFLKQALVSLEALHGSLKGG